MFDSLQSQTIRTFVYSFIIQKIKDVEKFQLLNWQDPRYPYQEDK